MLFITVILIYFVLIVTAIPTITYDGNACPDIVCNMFQGMGFATSGTYTRINPPDVDGNYNTYIHTVFNPVTHKPVNIRECTNKVKMRLISANRRVTCSKKGCSSSNTNDITLECDEFPLASTYQGGRGAFTRCIQKWQNGLAGIDIRIFYQQKKIADNAPFTINLINVPFNCPETDDRTILKQTPNAGQSTCAIKPF